MNLIADAHSAEPRARDSSAQGPGPIWVVWLFAILSILLTGALLGLAGRYLFFPGYFDHGEAHMAVRAWQFIRGGVVYADFASPDFLVTLHGPTPYWWFGLWTNVAGGGLAASKLGGFAALAVALAAFVAHVWRRFGIAWIAPGTAILAAFLLMVGQKSFWIRSDPLALMLVSLGLFLTAELGRTQRPWWQAPVALGAIAGLAANTKAHELLYLAPLAFGFAQRRWLVGWPLAGLVAAAAWGAPFALSAFPLDNYFSVLLRAAGKHEFEPYALFLSAKRVAIFLAPLVLLPFAWRRLSSGERSYALAYAGALGVVLYPASVSGSGWYQFMPVAPLTADLALRLARATAPARRTWAASALIVFIVFSAVVSWKPHRQMHLYMTDRAWMKDAADEIAGIIAGHPGGKIEMGYGRDVAETYRATFLRPLLVFAGNPAKFDGWSNMEEALLGFPPSPEKIARITACAADLWLIPAREPPFTMASVFPTSADFLAAYRQAFLAAYELRDRGQFFDIWRCRDYRSTGPSG